MIEPINSEQQKQVIDATQKCVAHASALYGRVFELPQIDFDLRGRSAGMYQVRGHQRRIRYNPWLFAKYLNDSLSDTIPHEVAHYVVDCLYGLRNVYPHGREWKAVIQDLGGQPKATGNYCLEGVPRRQYQTFDYRCACRTHQLTSIRHRKVAQNNALYRCRACGDALVAV